MIALEIIVVVIIIIIIIQKVGELLIKACRKQKQENWTLVLPPRGWRPNCADYIGTTGGFPDENKISRI